MNPFWSQFHRNAPTHVVSRHDGLKRKPPTKFLLGRWFAILSASLCIVAASNALAGAGGESIFTTQMPTLLSANDNVAYEMGTKFQSAVGGNITAIRYYRSACDLGPHTGNIWDAAGNKLASVGFAGETASGWQQQALGTPLPILANATYIVSVNTPGCYVDTPGGLASAVTNGDLSTIVGSNGVFGSPAGVFPTSSFNNSNYFRDVVFTPGTSSSACINLQKLVSVDGGKTFQLSTSLSSPVLEQSGIPAQYELIVSNCGNVTLNNLLVDDCVAITATGVPNGPPYSNCYYPELIPSTWPSGIANTLAPGTSVTFTKAQIPGLGTDLCNGQPANTVIQNNAEADSTSATTGAAVSIDTFALVKCPGATPTANIALAKQISVDGGATWYDADTTATAPVVSAPHGATYRFIVTNTGGQDLSNVTVSDATLGISSVSIGTLAAGQSVTITSASAGFSNLNQPNRCPVAGTYTNTATVVGTPVYGGANVMASNPAVLICQAVTPPCSTTGSNASNFNGTAIPSGDYIWFNSNFTANGVKDGTNFYLTQSTIQFSSNGASYSVLVPNAVITFKASVSCASTSFNTTLNRWETIVPLSGSDEIFLSGVGFPVPAGFQKGINPVTWNGTFATDTSGASLNWKWGAAVYTQFTTNYNQLGVKPTHTAGCSYSNSDHAGTPENFKSYVTGGARGGGGSNFTGSWSGTTSVTPLCH